MLVTAEGDRAFCTGADINGWGDLTPAEFARHWVRDGHRIFDRLARLRKPTVAVLKGHAFGGGLELAAACDIRVMAPAATLALPEAGVGIVPGWSGHAAAGAAAARAGGQGDGAVRPPHRRRARRWRWASSAEVADDPRAAALAHRRARRRRCRRARSRSPRR